MSELADLVAARVVELLERRDRRPTPGLVTAAEMAQRLGVRKSWVYANQEQLGAIRLGDGPRARLRFDLEQATSGIDRRREAEVRQRPKRGRPRKSSLLPTGVELLTGRRATSGGRG